MPLKDLSDQEEARNNNSASSRLIKILKDNADTFGTYKKTHNDFTGFHKANL